MQNKAWEVEKVESQLQVDDASQQGLQAGRTVTADAADFLVDTDHTTYEKRVMEDLDALLADLQSTTANISSYQKSQYPSQPHQLQHYQDQPHNYHHSSHPESQELQHSGQISSYTTQDQQLNNNSSSKEDQSHVYQHQEIHSSLKHPGSSRNQDSTSSQAQGSSTQGYSQPEITVLRVSFHSSGSNSGSSTPPPLPPPPLDILDYNRDFEQPIYEQQVFHRRETVPPAASDISDKVDVPPRTQVKDRGERMSALSNNLSELDQLLQDLNSAQFMAEVDRKSSNANEVTVVNGTLEKQPPPVAPKPSSKPVQRTSVDNLLDQLEDVGTQPARFPIESNYQELSTISTSHSQQHNGVPGTVYQAASTSSASSTASYYQPQTASTATKELDELMMSLSEFRSKGDGPANSNEPAYAKPVKSRTASDASPTSPHEAGHQVPNQMQLQNQQNVQQHQIQRENGLEVMLGDLQSDMSRQGVNIKQKGVCAACQKPIVGQVIAALGRTWHVEHFVCAHCEEPLGTQNFYERDSLAYCEKDYHQLFAPRCAYCNGAIVDKCITALEKMWHPEHFFCAQCGRPFGEDDFHEKNGKAYCRDDYFQMFAPKCGGCAHPIMENYITALNRQWHPECFVCWDCHANFGAGSFFDYEGLPYCETHYHGKKGSLCASCERPITGRCITAMFRKFHPEHFVCAFCLKQLNKGTFKEQNDKPYCHPCFVKLFG